MLETQAMLSRKHLAARLGISVLTLDRMLASGRCPEPVRIGRLLRWTAEEIDAWIAAGAPDRATWERTRQSKR